MAATEAQQRPEVWKQPETSCSQQNTNSFTTITTPQDYPAYPSTSSGGYLSDLQSMDSMYAWPYTNNVKPSDTAAWWDMYANAGSWLSNGAAPAMSYLPYGAPTADMSQHLSSNSLVIPSSQAFMPNYTSAFSSTKELSPTASSTNSNSSPENSQSRPCSNSAAVTSSPALLPNYTSALFSAKEPTPTSWFANGSAPAMAYLSYNTTTTDSSHPSSSFMPTYASNFTATKDQMSAPGSTNISPASTTKYSPTQASTSSRSTTTTGTKPSRSRRYGPTCECPNCQQIDKLGPSAAHLKVKGPHNCHFPGCGKVYNKSSHLKAHLRWHTGDKVTTNSRSEHAPPHSATGKRLSCPTCNKKFQKSDSLAKHILTHEVEQPKALDIYKTLPDMNNNNNIDPSYAQRQEMVTNWVSLAAAHTQQST